MIDGRIDSSVCHSEERVHDRWALVLLPVAVKIRGSACRSRDDTKNSILNMHTFTRLAQTTAAGFRHMTMRKKTYR